MSSEWSKESYKHVGIDGLRVGLYIWNLEYSSTAQAV
jgi:hypothetical protein